MKTDCVLDYASLSDDLRRRLAKLPTPFFLFDLDRIAFKLDLFRNSLQPEQLYYAVKCNSLPAVLATLAGKGCGFEANNRAELEKVLALGVSADRVINSSPIASAADVQAMYAKGVRHFVFDTRNQVENLKINAPECRAFLRIYTSNEGSRFDLSKRFGVRMEDAPCLLTHAYEMGLKVLGLTFHVGSQCSSPDNWCTGLRDCGKLFRRFPDLRIVNLGGGYPVNYDGAVPSIGSITQVIQDACKAYFESPPTLIAEPGRYLTADCALTGVSVIQVEEQEPVSRAVVDLSAYCSLFEIIESGGAIRYPAMTDARGEKMVSYRIGGFTCAGTDVLAEEMTLPRLRVDHRHLESSSRIYFACTGAYTLDFFDMRKKTGFNGASIPSVYYLKDEQLYEVDVASAAATNTPG